MDVFSTTLLCFVLLPLYPTDRIAFSLTTNNASVDWIVEIKAKTSVVLVPVALAFATRITSGLYPNSGNPLFPRPFPAQYIIWSSMSVIVVLNIAVAMIVFCIRERKKLNVCYLLISL